MHFPPTTNRGDLLSIFFVYSANIYLSVQPQPDWTGLDRTGGPGSDLRRRFPSTYKLFQMISFFFDSAEDILIVLLPLCFVRRQA